MIVAHLEFTVKHSMDVPMEGVTREMIQMDIERAKSDLIEGIKSDFAKEGREVNDVRVVFTEKISA